MQPRTRQPSTRRLNREEKRAANRRRLLDAAREVFASRGYHDATIEEIADVSGLSNGAVYYNFKSKDELFFAIFDEHIEARIELARRVFGGAEASDEATEKQVRTATVEAARAVQDPREWTLFFEFVAHAGRQPAFRKEFRRRLRTMRAVLAEVVEERAAALGAELPLPPDSVSMAISALAQGLAIHRIMDPNAVPDELHGQLVVYMLRGMAESA
jgi:AcrR family transcriptional regulator